MKCNAHWMMCIAALPEVPTIADVALPSYEMCSWFGVLGPAGRPCAIVDCINAVLRQVIALPHIRDRLIAQGTDPETDSSEALARLICTEVG